MSLSPGSQRIFTLEDVLAAINQKAENANNDGLSPTDQVAGLSVINETTKAVDAMTTTLAGTVTWGTAIYGEARVA